MILSKDSVKFEMLVCRYDTEDMDYRIFPFLGEEGKFLSRGNEEIYIRGGA